MSVEVPCPLLTHRDGVAALGGSLACNWCGKKLRGRQKRWCSKACSQTATKEHRWTQAKAAAKKAATFYECSECKEFFREVEVNHIVPCKGKHGQWGCWHHSSNLEVLCKGCHRTKTNEQGARNWE